MTIQSQLINSLVADDALVVFRRPCVVCRRRHVVVTADRVPVELIQAPDLVISSNKNGNKPQQSNTDGRARRAIVTIKR